MRDMLPVGPGFLPPSICEEGLQGKLEGDLPYGLGEGHCQLSTRVVVAEEDVGQGRSAFGAGIPGFEDGGDELVCPVDGERASVDEYQYDGLARGLYGLKQLQLPAGQVEAGARLFRRRCVVRRPILRRQHQLGGHFLRLCLSRLARRRVSG